ncbi:MAG: hypothetical protein ACFB22_01380 [Rhodothalassiaceae bacterium]
MELKWIMFYELFFVKGLLIAWAIREIYVCNRDQKRADAARAAEGGTGRGGTGTGRPAAP